MFNKESNLLNNLKFRTTNSSAKLKRKYDHFNEFSDQNESINKQFESIDRKIPWKAIVLALFLLIVGSIVITMSCLILTGFVPNLRPNDGIVVLFFLGFVTFIPGLYHIRIAYYAYYRYPGFAFEDIPDFD